jgi:hypothetical protein
VPTAAADADVVASAGQGTRASGVGRWSREGRPSGQVTEALTILGLIIRRSRGEVRARFREQLRAVNLADPCDPGRIGNGGTQLVAPRPVCPGFAAILDDLGQPEQALALAAIAALTTTATRRIVNPSP